MLREEGYELTLAARRPEPLEEAAKELGAQAVAANLGDPDECVRVVAAHAERFGGMDVLVNSAGIGIGGSFGDQADEGDSISSSTSTCARRSSSRASRCPLLRATRGHVINLASIAGTIPTPGLAVYGATKAARHLVHELAEPRGGRQRRPRDRDLPRVRRDEDDRVDGAPGRGDDPGRGRRRARARDPAPEPAGARARRS